MEGNRTKFIARPVAAWIALLTVLSAIPALMAEGPVGENGAGAIARAVTDNYNDLIVPAGETCTYYGCHTYARSVQINGTLKVAPYDAREEARGTLWLEAPWILVGPGGAILADGRGFGGGGGGSEKGSGSGKAGALGNGGNGDTGGFWGAGGGGGSNGGLGGGGGSSGYGTAGTPGTETNGGNGGNVAIAGYRGGLGGTGFGGGGGGGAGWYPDGAGGGGGRSGGKDGSITTGGAGGGTAGGTAGTAGGANKGANGGYAVANGNGDTSTDPSISKGSGGGGGSTVYYYGGAGGGGAGGGSVALVSKGSIDIFGKISTTGGGGGKGGMDGNGYGGDGGGGAGGGIALMAGKLNITGNIDARGRNQDTLSNTTGGTVKLFSAENSTASATINAGRVFRSDRPRMQGLLEPPQGGFASPQPVFMWENALDPNNDPVTYEMLVAADDDFTDILFEKGGMHGNSTQLPFRLPGQQYFWKVRASDSFNYGFWSATGSFVVDDVPPVSTVAPLPGLVSTADFNVSWSGIDGQVEVASYSVLVSDNEAAFHDWLANTSLTTKTFSGEDGHTYRFYSIATDRFGNRESAPLLPDAATTVDTTPPRSSIVPLGPYQGQATFKVAWSGQDGGSGISDYTVYVSKDGVNFTVWLDSTIKESGNYTGLDGMGYTFFVRARDMAGNLEPAPGSELRTSTRVDISAPASNISVSAPSYGDQPVYIRPNNTVTLSATDGTSGVDAIFFAMDSAGASKYISPLQDLPAGSHNLSYWSADIAGNEEARRTLWMFVDGQAPSTTLAIDGPSWTGPAATYLSNATKMVLSATDAGCGLDRIMYSTGSAPVAYSGPFTLNMSGIATLKYWSVDRLGNEEAQKALTVMVDMNPPSTVATAPTGAVSDVALVRLNASDDASGVADTFYRITPPGGSAQAWQKGTDIVIQAKKDHSADGIHKVEYYSVDRMGNPEPAKGIQVVIDTTVTIDIASASGTTVTRSNYTFTGKVEPGSSVSVNGQPAQVTANGNFSSDINLVKGSNMLVVTVTDPVGNARTVTSEVIYKKPVQESPKETISALNLVLIVLVVLMAIIIVVLLLRKGGQRPSQAPQSYPPAPAPQQWPQPSPPPVPQKAPQEGYQPAPAPQGPFPPSPPPVPPPQPGAPPPIPPPDMVP